MSGVFGEDVFADLVVLKRCVHEGKVFVAGVEGSQLGGAFIEEEEVLVDDVVGSCCSFEVV